MFQEALDCLSNVITGKERLSRCNFISQRYSPFEYHNKINLRLRFEIMQNLKTFLNMNYTCILIESL